MRSGYRPRCQKHRLATVAALDEPRTAIIYRVPEDADDGAAVLANLEARGVAYAAPLDLQRQLWERGGAFAKLAHRVASRQHLGGAL